MRGPKQKPNIICKRCNRDAVPVREFYCRNCASTLVTSGELEKIQIDNTAKELTKTQQDTLSGLMLGDGCLYRRKETHNPYLVVVRKQDDRDYLKDNYEVFKEFCKRGVIDGSLFDKRTNNTTYFSKFSTRRCGVFKSYYEKWYPNGKKIVPDDIELNPLTLAIWFCDDGYMRFSSSGKIRIQLSTDGFDEKYVVLLKNMLEKRYNKEFTITSNFRLNAYDESASIFLKEIEKYIPNSMVRKIKWSNKYDNC
jgi:hypothetical protein